METPEKWPSMILQTDWLFGPQCIYVCLCMIKITGMWKPSYSIKPAASPVPTAPELYKIHPIMWTLVYKVRLCPTSSGFKDRAFIVAHHANLQVATLYGNREIWKCSLFMLNSLKTHYHAYWKYTGSPELRIPLYARHAVVVPTVSALEGFHCNYKIYCEEVTLGSFWGIYVGLYLISILFAMWSHKKKLSIHKYVIIVCIGKLVSVVAISIALNWPILTHFLGN